MKNWYGAEILNFCELYDNKLNFRTNNIVEHFHYILNNTIENYRPKLPFFLEKYKILINRTYDKYVNNIKYLNSEDKINNGYKSRL